MRRDLRAVYTIDEAAILLGPGRDALYRQVAATGEIDGIHVICISNRQHVAKAFVNKRLGISEARAEEILKRAEAEGRLRSTKRKTA